MIDLQLLWLSNNTAIETDILVFIPRQLTIQLTAPCSPTPPKITLSA